MFPYLDKDNDGDIDFNEYCGMCEERRLNLDPYINNSKHIDKS
jgi:hypothetical protein